MFAMSHYEIWSRAEDFGNLSSMFCFTSMVAVLVASLVSFSILVINNARSKTYGVKRVKDQLSREQVDLVVKRQWKEVLAWIVFHPDELCHLDRNGQSILHHACLFRAPAEIIQMILWQAPELAAVPNPDGELPLHWAVRLSAPNEQIDNLLTACPESGTWAKDNGGNTPLTLLWDRHCEGILEQWWADRGEVRNLHSWKRIMLFFRCEIVDEDECDGEIVFGDTPLHVASRCPCPPGFFPLLLQVFREDAVRRDTKGRLPLHLACSNAFANRSTDVLSKVQALVSVCRDACNCVDFEGRKPFHVALEAGITWEEGLKELVESEPRLMNGRDPRTNLDPFLLAATAEHAARSLRIPFMEGKKSSEYSRNTLDTVYKLLRMEPSRIVITL